MTQAELRALLADALVLWGVAGRVVPDGDGVAVQVAAARCIVAPAPPGLRPVRWFVTTPERAGRAAASIAGVLGVVRAWAEEQAVLSALHGAAGP